MKEKMECPDCGVNMNHHAEKLNYTVMQRKPDTIDFHLEGVIEEFHTCPQCGKTEIRNS